MLNFDEAPADPIERLMWLSGAKRQIGLELDAEFRRLYFQCRLEQRLDEAESLGLHSHKKVMAYTRAENESRGRMVRWGDRRS